MINKVRRLLIRVGKVLPFVICALVLVNYFETMVALLTNDLLRYDDIIIPNTRLSFFIGQYFEYNLQMLVVLCIISIAIETCVFNKLACLYLGINLVEKAYFDFELDPWAIYTICLANIVVAVYLTLKGIRIIIPKQNRL